MSFAQKTFYIETFGCQMNFHDSEKVVGTLISEGYAQVQREEEADLILYNTCSIRDKAEQKVFHRLNDFKKLRKEGKRFAVLGCVAQQEGEKIFERAPHVSLVAGSASYRNLPEMLVQIEAGADRVTGLDDRQTDQAFETEFTARTNPHRGYITIIEGCDKFCAYCVVPYTRGKERSRTSHSVLDEARRMADGGFTEIQLLGQNVNSYRDPAGKKSFAELLTAVGELPGMRRVRFTTSHPRDFTKDIVDAIDAVPTLCDHVHLPVQSGSSRVLESMFREYTREQYLERISWMKSTRNRETEHHHRRHRRLPGRNRSGIRRDAWPARRGRLRRRLLVQVLAAAQHAGVAVCRLDSGRGEIAPPANPAGASARTAEVKLSQASRADT